MTIKQLKDQIEAHVLIEEVKIDEEYVPHVASLTFESNYMQILYLYGIDVLLVVLKVLERNEVYEQCAVLKQVIINHNKLEGTSFPTKIKTYE